MPARERPAAVPARAAGSRGTWPSTPPARGGGPRSTRGACWSDEFHDLRASLPVVGAPRLSP